MAASGSVRAADLLLRSHSRPSAYPSPLSPPAVASTEGRPHTKSQQNWVRLWTAAPDDRAGFDLGIQKTQGDFTGVLAQPQRTTGPSARCCRSWVASCHDAQSLHGQGAMCRHHPTVPTPKAAATRQSSRPLRTIRRPHARRSTECVRVRREGLYRVEEVRRDRQGRLAGSRSGELC
jgi:hypothetical protein